MKGMILFPSWLKQGYTNYNCFLAKCYIKNKGQRIFYRKSDPMLHLGLYVEYTVNKQFLIVRSYEWLKHL